MPQLVSVIGAFASESGGSFVFYLAGCFGEHGGAGVVAKLSDGDEVVGHLWEEADGTCCFG